MSKFPNGNVSIIIPTFGDFETWNRMSLEATNTAVKETRKPGKVIRVHQDTLAMARNLGALEANTDWIIFLDADDTLRRGYCEAMLQAAEGCHKGIFRPNTIAVVDGVEEGVPQMIPRSNLFDSNCAVIGSMVSKEQFFKVGGFRELERLEDWDLFLRLYIDGAELVDVPEAIYRVGYRTDSRNQSDSKHAEIASEIRSIYAPYRNVHADQE